jgi:hypothetical protein
MSDHRALRTPRDAGGFAPVQRLHHDGVGRLDAHALARDEHTVLAVALAGQPDAAGDHGEFASTPADPTGLTGKEALAERVQGRQREGSGVRVHHQSPSVRACIIGVNSSSIQ